MSHQVTRSLRPFDPAKIRRNGVTAADGKTRWCQAFLAAALGLISSVISDAGAEVVNGDQWWWFIGQQWLMVTDGDQSWLVIKLVLFMAAHGFILLMLIGSWWIVGQSVSPGWVVSSAITDLLSAPSGSLDLLDPPVAKFNGLLGFKNDKSL